MSDKYTVIVTVFDRPAALRRFLEAYGRRFADVPLVVVDDGRSPCSEADLMAAGIRNGKVIALPFDSGICMKRNIGAEAAQTPYIVICEDDMRFTAETRLDGFAAVLDADPGIDIIAGALYYGETKRGLCSSLEFDPDTKALAIRDIPLKWREWKSAAGVKYCRADYVFNFFMMRRDAARWDERLKIGIEHLAFFYGLKTGGKASGVAYTPDVSAWHDDVPDTADYERYRRRLDYWADFAERYGISYILNMQDYMVSDLRERRVASYPEYLWNLMAAYGRHKYGGFGVESAADQRR